MIIFNMPYEKFDKIISYVVDTHKYLRESDVPVSYLFESFEELSYKECTCIITDTKKLIGVNSLEINFKADVENHNLYVECPRFFRFYINVNYDTHETGLYNFWAVDKSWEKWLMKEVGTQVLISTGGHTYDAYQALHFVQTFFCVNYFVYHLPAQVTNEVVKHTEKVGKPGKKKRYKQILKTYVDIHIPTGIHKDVIFTCPCWEVRGHQRHLKDGRVIYIKGYKKGKLRNKTTACDRDVKIGGV